MSKGKRTKEKNKCKNKFLKVIAVIYGIVTIMFCTAILKMNLLPKKYILIFLIVELVLTILVGLGLSKNHKTKKLNIMCFIIALILASGYLLAIKYVNITMNFLENLFQEIVETEDYYVVVNKDSKYENIEELTNKEIFIFQIEDDIRADIENKVQITLTNKESLSEIGNSLINNEVEAILISASQYDMIDEEFENFKNNTRIIYTSIHKVKKVKIEDINSQYSVKNKSFNIYISGIDTEGKINNVSRSDANILVTVNTETHKILLTSIPRDYYVTLHSKKAKDKLTHSGIYGINETVTTVEDLLDTEINYYVRVNFTTVIKLVNVLGGIDVNSEYNFSSNGYSFKKGINHLDGEAALWFSRERHSFKDGDNQRVKNQQLVISAIINKVTNSKTILTKYTRLLNTLDGCFQTNIEQEDISQMVKEQLDNMPSWKIETNSLVGSDAYGHTYSAGSQELYIMIPNSTSVKEATQKINEVLNSKNEI